MAQKNGQDAWNAGEALLDPKMIPNFRHLAWKNMTNRLRCCLGQVLNVIQVEKDEESHSFSYAV